MSSTVLHILMMALLGTLALAAEAPVPGYDVFIPEWDVKATPDGETTLRINGTVEEVVAELEQVNPDYKRSIGIADPDAMEQTQDNLQKRQMVRFASDKVVCGHFAKADAGKVMAAVNYLNGVSGRPRNGGGPAKCGRVSCGYGVAVWFCNDAPQPRELRSFGDIADGVYAIQDICKQGQSKYSGQAFHEDNWNVIVRGEDC